VIAKLLFLATVKDILYPRVGKSCHCSGTSIIIQNSTLLLTTLTLQGLRYVMLQINLSTTTQTNIEHILISIVYMAAGCSKAQYFHAIWQWSAFMSRK